MLNIKYLASSALLLPAEVEDLESAINQGKLQKQQDSEANDHEQLGVFLTVLRIEAVRVTGIIPIAINQVNKEDDDSGD